jgi:hypothetical protein
MIDELQICDRALLAPEVCQLFALPVAVETNSWSLATLHYRCGGACGGNALPGVSRYRSWITRK